MGTNPFEFGQLLIEQEDGGQISGCKIAKALEEAALRVEKGQRLLLVDAQQRVVHPNESGDFLLESLGDYMLISSEKELQEVTSRMKKKCSESSRNPRSFAKRDCMAQIEREMQEMWAESRAFEMDPPADADRAAPSFLITFPMPYMNGCLHLGHTFSLSKPEFACGYQRMLGKRALFPLGFHATGMPIKASADKLRQEIEAFGNPPVFPEEEEESPRLVRIFVPQSEQIVQCNVGRSRKSKAASKTSNAKYQWRIMQSLGIPDEEISKFVDPKHWIDYFPYQAMGDLRALGSKIDWRRAFVTVFNPYYDKFVQWQFWRLKDAGKIQFGKRITIYSPKDGCACMDHDRQTGEGVLPMEYTAVKQRLLEPYPEKLKELAGKKIYLIAATLRPETMYGQTNSWVLPGGEYGVYEMRGGEYFVCTARAARNMSFQDRSLEWGEARCVASLKGSDLVGSRVRSPLCLYDSIYVLPMMIVSMEKGTGIVASVPNQSPHDWVAWHDLLRKPEGPGYCVDVAKMLEPYEILPIVHLPDFGDQAAEVVVKSLKIRSQHDHALLERAKGQLYLKGFYTGVLKVGPYAGQSVEKVKERIRDEMVEAGDAFLYCEPASEVVSRSGDVCVAAYIDQWYLDYGEPSWRALAEECLSKMKFYGNDSRQLFERGLEWMGRWACSRSYGLGSRIPWDDQFLVESLSDSSIYMAYFTVAPYLHSDIEGRRPGCRNVHIRPEEMTCEVWDFIFRNGSYPEGTEIPREVLEEMRREFLYWYPVELRASGKDLVTNHLLFWIYNHVAMFEPRAWPRGVQVNGHALLNKAKMSKSTGNFITLREGVNRFTADAMRFALADAGDTLDDANFAFDVADGALLRLHAQLEWTKEVLADIKAMKGGVSSVEVQSDAGGDGVCAESAQRSPRRQKMDSESLVLTVGGELLSNLSGDHKGLDALSSSLDSIGTPKMAQPFRTSEFNFMDRVFANQMWQSVKATNEAYSAGMYKEAIKQGFFDLQNYRDTYRDTQRLHGSAMHMELILCFIKIQALLICPICPHWAEYVWTRLLQQDKSIMCARMPVVSSEGQGESRPVDGVLGLSTNSASVMVLPPVDHVCLEQYDYLMRNLHLWRVRLIKQRGSSKGRQLSIKLTVARRYQEWQELSVALLKELYLEELDGKAAKTLPSQNLMLDRVSRHPTLKSHVGKVMPLLNSSCQAFKTRGEAVFLQETQWDEAQFLEDMKSVIKNSLEVGAVEIEAIERYDASIGASKKSRNACAVPVPGCPKLEILQA
ncbi:leucine--tRNA ligase, cytoplasmic-like isoform X2 [Schistocerca gregaria]|uniref:leucine--tRNA ligase, cytoplasmic-like isoform X2 n=1 Tax=Schistocerca gregaria TaxID=7010 RepID=UPI00211F020F|nr:leucine--tRNA ligase, cytoplasmic-like isoform X2 [Schistocerca gregaria]